MDHRMKELARLAVVKGAAIKKGQVLDITSDVEAVEFTREVVKQAYAAGASHVEVTYTDKVLNRIVIENDSEEQLINVPAYITEKAKYMNDVQAASIRISAADPDVMEGIDAERVTKRSRASSKARKAESIRSDELMRHWNVVAVPTVGWAKKLFPELPEKEAMDALWDAIFLCCYVDEGDAVANWQKHLDTMRSNIEKLNAMKIKKLHFTTGLGTDIELDMCEGGLFCGGCNLDAEGMPYSPNIPSEEIFTTPHKFSVNGTVKGSMPLCHNGGIIDGMSFTFRDGVVTDYSAEKGYDILKGIIETDEGARMLGECALVSYDSPIRRTGLLFYSTLFDENAVCHFALGQGYAEPIMGGNLPQDELKARGMNESMVHVDFMFGTADLKCEATLENGEKVFIMNEGHFVI